MHIKFSACLTNMRRRRHAGKSVRSHAQFSEESGPIKAEAHSVCRCSDCSCRRVRILTVPKLVVLALVLFVRTVEDIVPLDFYTLQIRFYTRAMLFLNTAPLPCVRRQAICVRRTVRRQIYRVLYATTQSREQASAAGVACLMCSADGCGSYLRWASVASRSECPPPPPSVWVPSMCSFACSS